MGPRRVFVDGDEWEVWEVRPGVPLGGPLFPLRKEMATGWLAVRRPGEMRRIAPIPPRWEDWADAQLVVAVRRAKLVR